MLQQVRQDFWSRKKQDIVPWHDFKWLLISQNWSWSVLSWMFTCFILFKNVVVKPFMRNLIYYDTTNSIRKLKNHISLPVKARNVTHTLNGRDAQIPQHYIFQFKSLTNKIMQVAKKFFWTSEIGFLGKKKKSKATSFICFCLLGLWW